MASKKKQIEALESLLRQAEGAYTALEEERNNLVDDLDDLGVRALNATGVPSDYSRGLVDGGINVAVAMAGILNAHGV